jgi:hypothetical protein
MDATQKLRTAGIAAALIVAVAGASSGGQELAAAHWPMAPADLESLLATEDFEILSAKGGIGGVMGAKKLEIRFPKSGQVLKVKWKRAPNGKLDGFNNTPRKEIAAYEIQKWFLDPVDYVVPTIVARCVPLTVYPPVEANAGPSLPDTRCVMGVLVVWLENVGIDGPIYEEARFTSDPVYARHMAEMNLLTYLIDHDDGRRNNFLTADDPTDRYIFSIDNGVSFGAKLKNWFVPNWDRIRVPALRKASIDRLRQVSADQVDSLGVVAELRADDDGVLRPVEHSPNANPKKGARVEAGWVQLGLRTKEIGNLRKRMKRLLEDVDAGRIHVF